MANFANTKSCKKQKNNRNQMGTYLQVLSESYPMNTNMTGFGCFSKSLYPCASYESSLRINPFHAEATYVQREKNVKTFENHLNPVFLVFIGKLSLSNDLMSTHVSWFKSFFSFFASFCIDQIYKPPACMQAKG